ncbi:glycosyltransferase [Flavobacterium sp.]|jgi:glycosyltransferase involved in cell wall biosynthesis|uniref:glycosyltransferase n=1 Tax=Flavobacterium sp. TaxID=239 RepID=UPI0037BFD2BC
MRILYFYPENPLSTTQGNNARALSLLQYFQNRKITLDFVSVASDSFSLKDIKEMEDTNLISKGYLLKQFKRSKNQIKYFFFYSLPNKIFRRIKSFNRRRINNQACFNAILKSNEYDYIIISYAYWAGLVIDTPYTKNAKLCIDTHDFLTSQFQSVKGFNLARYFQKEIEILRNFDKIFVISTEENYVFSQFVDKEIISLSHIIENHLCSVNEEKKFDLIYVASSNSHNVLAADWFFKEVYPLLRNSIRILTIGKICQYIKDYVNVTKVEFVENLNDYYSTSRVAICPMLSGTGLKIKVIEAMSFGLPVVGNIRANDGLSNKSDNGCLITNSPLEFANNIEKLLSNELFYEEISDFGKNYFLKNNDKQNCYKEIDAIFEINS